MLAGAAFGAAAGRGGGGARAGGGGRVRAAVGACGRRREVAAGWARLVAAATRGGEELGEVAAGPVRSAAASSGSGGARGERLEMEARGSGRAGPARPCFLLGLGPIPRAAVGIAEAVGVYFFLFFPHFLLLSLNLFNLLNSLIFCVDY